MIGLSFSKNLLIGIFCHLDLNLLTHALIQNSLLLLTPEWISCSTKPYRDLPLEPSSLPLSGEQWGLQILAEKGQAEMRWKNKEGDARERRGWQLLLNK